MAAPSLLRAIRAATATPRRAEDVIRELDTPRGQAWFALSWLLKQGGLSMVVDSSVHDTDDAADSAG